MAVKITKVDHYSVIEIDGDLDGKTSPLTLEQMKPALLPDHHLILDFNRVEFMSSAGIRMLLSLHRQLKPGQKLVITGFSEQIQDTMAVTGFLNLFNITATLEEARARVQ